MTKQSVSKRKQTKVDGGSLRLNLGCGLDHRDGFVNVDLFTTADVHDDIAVLATFHPESVDEIYSAHSLEHLGQYEGRRALVRWHELLKPGGALTVIVPDIIFNLRLFLEVYDLDPDKVWDFRAKTIWGNQNHGGEYHRWGYDAAELRRALTEAGFVDIAITKAPGRDFDFGDFPDSCYQATARRSA